MVRNFDIEIDEDKGISRMLISGFLSYDEALQYARQLYSDAEMPEKLKGCKRIIVSEDNLKLLGTKYSYEEYDRFFEQALAPLHISEEQLLTIPETVETAKESQTEDEAAAHDALPPRFHPGTGLCAGNGRENRGKHHVYEGLAGG